MYVKRDIDLPIMWHFSAQFLLFFVALSSAVLYLYEVRHWTWIALPFLPIGTIGTAVAFYIGFKNNSSYERLWEARKVWGSISNNSRSFVATLISTSRNGKRGNDKAGELPDLATLHRELAYRQLAWANLLRLQLRKFKAYEQYAPEPLAHQLVPGVQDGVQSYEAGLEYCKEHFLSEIEFEQVSGSVNGAMTLLQNQLNRLAEMKRADLINDYEHGALLALVSACFEHQGACERTKSFPFPRQYAYFSGTFTWIFIILLPFGLVGELEHTNHLLAYLTVPFSVLISWIFLTMEQVGDSSEDPFENAINDVPMHMICRNIEIDVRSMLGESELPEPLKPVSNIAL
jgi:putative membrane protein